MSHRKRKYSPSVLVVKTENEKLLELSLVNFGKEINSDMAGLLSAMQASAKVVNSAMESLIPAMQAAAKIVNDFGIIYKNGLPPDLQDKINRLSFKNSNRPPK